MEESADRRAHPQIVTPPPSQKSRRMLELPGKLKPVMKLLRELADKSLINSGCGRVMSANGPSSGEDSRVQPADVSWFLLPYGQPCGPKPTSTPVAVCWKL